MNKNIINAAFLTVASLAVSTNASATANIMAQNGAPACSSCHTGGAFTKSEGKAGLAAFLAAKAPKPPVVVTPPVVVKPPVVVTPPVVVQPPVVKPPVVIPPIANPPVVTPLIPKPTTAVSCNKAAKDYEREDHDDNDHDDDHDKGKSATGLTISAPGTKTIHAGQTLKLGVTASGDNRKIAMGVNLPAGAKFAESYNGTLQTQQGVVSWKVPKTASGKTVKIKFCAETHSNDKHGKRQDVRFVSRDVSVKVLPKLKTVPAAQTAADPVIASATYSASLHQLVVSGQIKWPAKSTPAERQASIVTPVQLSNANNAALLGTAHVQSNGDWSVSIPLSSVIPSDIDATFQGAVATKLVKKLP